MVASRGHIQLLGLWGLLTISWGCTGLFNQIPQRTTDQDSNPLPSIATSQEAVQLEIVFAKRPINDPLLGDALWQEVDQIGAIEAGKRKLLQKNGFRIGVASSDPPRALESMLGLSAKSAALSRASSQNLRGRRVVLRSGADTEIQTSPLYRQCRLEIAGRGQTKSEQFQQARCVLRVKVNRLQGGWARLEFLPEIHHGPQRLRRKAQATEGIWRLHTSQNIEKLYDQRFEITLNVGEMVVVSCDQKNPRSVGHRFFIPAGDNPEFQRLLVVRLADLKASEGLYQDE